MYRVPSSRTPMCAYMYNGDSTRSPLAAPSSGAIPKFSGFNLAHCVPDTDQGKSKDACVALELR